MIMVDRDDSDLSRALTKHLGSRFELVTGIGDDTYDLCGRALQEQQRQGQRRLRVLYPGGV